MVGMADVSQMGIPLARPFFFFFFFISICIAQTSTNTGKVRTRAITHGQGAHTGSNCIFSPRAGGVRALLRDSSTLEAKGSIKRPFSLESGKHKEHCRIRGGRSGHVTCTADQHEPVLQVPLHPALQWVEERGMGPGPLQGALMWCWGICMHEGVSYEPLARVCAQLRAGRGSHDR